MVPYVVGIAGGTASGKTTVATRYAKEFGAALIGHDRYYYNIHNPRGFNFDHPDALETSLLVQQLSDLKQGKAVELPIYVFGSHHRSPETERLEPAPLMVVEGILVLSDERLRSCFDFMVFVDAPADIRLIRRLRRDTITRGRSMENVLSQYEETVRPMHERYVQPTASYAGLTLDGLKPVPELVEQLAAAVAAGQRSRGGALV